MFLQAAPEAFLSDCAKQDVMQFSHLLRFFLYTIVFSLNDSTSCEMEITSDC